MLRLKEILKERHITLTAFSKKVGISQANLSNYINGNVSPTLSTLEKIADALGIELADLFQRKKAVEMFVRYNGKEYPLDRNALLTLINEKDERNQSE